MNPLKDFLRPKYVVGLQVKDGFIGAVQIYVGLKGPEIDKAVFVEAADPERLQEELARLFQEQGFKKEMIVASIPSSKAFIREITLPLSQPKKVEKIIKYQMEPYLPCPVEDVLVDFLQPGADGGSVGDAARPRLTREDLERQDEEGTRRLLAGLKRLCDVCFPFELDDALRNRVRTAIEPQTHFFDLREEGAGAAQAAVPVASTPVTRVPLPEFAGFFLDDKQHFVPIAQANVEPRCVEDAMDYSASVLRSAAADQVLWSGDAINISGLPDGYGIEPPVECPIDVNNVDAPTPIITSAVWLLRAVADSRSASAARRSSPWSWPR